MQLGVRWRAGEAPHPSVPGELHAALRAQEAVFPAAHSWTLTWLESRPRCMLDDLVLVWVDARGEVHTQSVELGIHADTRRSSPEGADRLGRLLVDESDEDDEDDDWLG